MLSIHSRPPRSMLSEPAAASSTPADPFTAANPPGGFASLLRQAAPAPVTPTPAPTAQTTQAAPAPAQQAPSAAPPARHAEAAHEPAHEATAEADSTDATATTETAPASHARALLSARLRAAAAPRSPQAHAETAEAGDPASSESTAPDASTASTSAPNTTDPMPQPAASATPIDPNILQWLAGQQRAAGPSLPAGDANGTGPSHEMRAVNGRADGPATSTDATSTLSASVTDGQAQRAPDLKTDTEAKGKPAPGQAARDAAADAGRFAPALGEQHTAEKPQPTQTTAVAGPTAAALAAMLAPARPAAFEAAAPAAVAIATPVSAPEFAQALGLQMSLLTRDGIQHAELHLNPAEMGPVSVQIVMDGTQARVDFGADLAATRQAIEAGLPELASALRDAGFTLAGGGVSQHAGGRSGADGNGTGDNGRRQRSTASVSPDAVGRVSAAAQRIASAGGIDVFA